MKKAILFLLLPLSLSAQLRQGAIVYERKTDVHRRMQDEQMKAMVPRFQTGDYEVLFRDSIAVYKAMPKDEAPDPFDNNSGGNRVRLPIPSTTTAAGTVSSSGLPVVAMAAPFTGITTAAGCWKRLPWQRRNILLPTPLLNCPGGSAMTPQPSLVIPARKQPPRLPGAAG
jgi:hypothetical protein